MAFAAFTKRPKYSEDRKIAGKVNFQNLPERVTFKY